MREVTGSGGDSVLLRVGRRAVRRVGLRAPQRDGDNKVQDDSKAGNYLDGTICRPLKIANFLAVKPRVSDSINPGDSRGSVDRWAKLDRSAS